jgi:hypothetical protein
MEIVVNGKRTDGGRSRIAPLTTVSSRVGVTQLVESWADFCRCCVELQQSTVGESLVQIQPPTTFFPNWIKDERCRCTS